MLIRNNPKIPQEMQPSSLNSEKRIGHIFKDGKILNTEALGTLFKHAETPLYW